MNVVLAGYGVPPVPLESYRGRVGWGLKELARRTIPEDVLKETSFEAITAAFHDAYAAHPLDHTTVYPGMESIIHLLRSQNIRMAVFSNKPDGLVSPIVDHFFAGVFDWVRGSVDGTPRKPDAAALDGAFPALGAGPAETVLVGDSEIDIETAKNAGCRSVAVSWGYRDKTVLEEAGPDHIVDTVDDLRSVLVDG